MEYLFRPALLALVAGVATAGDSLPFENAPGRRPPNAPLEAWLVPTTVVASMVICCCILPLCCSLRYGFAPNIRSNRDGVEMTDQTGPRQSITEHRALRIVVANSPNPEGSQHSSGSDSSSSGTRGSQHSSGSDSSSSGTRGSQHSSGSDSSSSGTRGSRHS